MKLALIGPTGQVGSRLLDEALRRGHAVTALSRHPDKLAARPGLTVVKADVYDAAQVASAVAGHDGVLDAFNPGWGDPDIRSHFMKGTKAILDGVKRSGVKRILVVGGAGSLFVAPGVQLVDTPGFPAEWKEGAMGAREALKVIQGEAALDWTFISPPVFLETHGGQRTGAYSLGADEVLMDGDKPAGISVEDLAVAILDEVERPAHIRKRFTAARV
ncbi:MAG TPA: NAD(P)-dependent oxidoreductase [Holophagaceae bacterium]|jgi:putative NADH-flavin reductase|nr:NAD(P)-dependent oxidoreductase [Holophagaceae bacterium]